MHACSFWICQDRLDRYAVLSCPVLSLLAPVGQPCNIFVTMQSSGPSGAEEDDPGQPAVQIETLRQRSLESDLRRKALLANKGDGQ